MLLMFKVINFFENITSKLSCKKFMFRKLQI